jgi:MoaA/NifB/PqqE/SkfB family radical SAM enzyme
MNGLRFRFLKWRGAATKPQALSLEITHRCIARCVMCNIWRIPDHVPDLTTEDWVRLLSSELFSDLIELDITGGEPFLKRDLPDLFAGISELKKRNLTALQSVALTSNGFLTERILDYVPAITERLGRENLELVMVCALDAVGELHDKIRNYKGAWTKVSKTIEGLIRLRNAFPNLIIGIKATVLPVNVVELPKIVDFADANGLFTIISPHIITEGRYLNADRAEDLAFSLHDNEQLATFFRGEKSRWSFHGKTLTRYFETGAVTKPCSCGFNYFFVRSNGEVFLCPLINKSVGNIMEHSIESLWHSPIASEIRRAINRFEECRRCTEPGLERYALSFEGWTYLSLLIKMGKKAFFELHRHMGLDKYFL